jgi:hypothetical protein
MNIMRLFQILTRHVATGKIKVTKKLLHQLHRETSGKRRSKPPNPPGTKHHECVCSSSARLAGGLIQEV